MFSLYSYINGKKAQDMNFHFGYCRLEALSAITNIIFLAILSCFNLLNDAHHYVDGLYAEARI